MSERRDDTTEPDAASRAEERGREPGSYYYDDSTNYEVYDPAKDDEDEDENCEEDRDPVRK